MDWTTVVWRLLCGLTIMSGLVALTGLWGFVPPAIAGLMMMPGLLVTLCFLVECWADWCASRGKSMNGSRHE